MLAELLTAEPYVRHQEQLASDAAVHQAVADALLQCCLPALAAAASAEAAAGELGSVQTMVMLQRLPDLLLHPSLEPAIRQRLKGPRAVEAVQAAIQIGEALPLPRPASMAAAEFGEFFCCVLTLLAASIVLMAEEADPQVGGSSGAAAAEPASASGFQQQVAWQLVAALPRLAGAIQALADDPDAATACQSDQDLWSSNLGVARGNLS